MSMISNYIERMKASFVPQVDTAARIAMDGTVVVRTNTANGKEWLGVKDGGMVAYPEEFLLDEVPVYTIAKTLDQVKPGDIVKATSSTYARVEKVENGQIYSVSFGGNVRRNNPITDFLTQQKTVRVVVNPFTMAGGTNPNNNMMLLMMLDGKESGKSDIAEVMMVASMLNGQGAANPFGSMMSNPMALLALSKGNGGGSLKDIMLLQMIQSNGFAVSAPAPAAKPADLSQVAPAPAEPVQG
jgi:hypothetical protein